MRYCHISPQTSACDAFFAHKKKKKMALRVRVAMGSKPYFDFILGNDIRHSFDF